MIRIRLPVLAVIASLAWPGPAGAARSADTPAPANARGWEQAMSRSAILGMQLGLQRAVDTGKASTSMRDCVDAIESTALVPLFHDILGRALSPDEIAMTERFWRSDAGAHFDELLMSQLYDKVGFVSPHKPAPLNADEQAQLDKLNAEPAWKKLADEVGRRQSDGETAISVQMRALLRSCQAKAG